MRVEKKRGRKKLLLVAACVGVIMLGGGSYFALRSFAENHGGSIFGSTSDTANNTPTFTTILPSGKSIDDLGGWKRVSPPQSDPAFAYADTIDGAAITVTEQPIPGTFENNVDTHVASLANSYNATNKIDAGGTSIYVGSSAKGPQSVIFTKNNLLILIKSYSHVDDNTWADYVKSLGVS